MSGLEAVGIAASIIQMADLGTKLSVKLFTLYRKHRNLTQSIQSLSSDVALTCAIVHELGSCLRQDEQTNLSSPEAYDIAHHVLKKCEEVLQKIQKMIDESESSAKSHWEQATSRLRKIINQPNLDVLKIDLERMKTTVLLLLNTIIYHVPTTLHEQRALIESLLEEKKNQANPKRIQAIKADGKDANMESLQQNGTVSNTSNTANSPSPFTYDNVIPLTPSSGVAENNQELQEYDCLIELILREIDHRRDIFQHTRHNRIRGGILNIHSGEIVQFQRTHGASILDFFDDSVFELSENPISFGAFQPRPMNGIFSSETDDQMPEYSLPAHVQNTRFQQVHNHAQLDGGFVRAETSECYAVSTDSNVASSAYPRLIVPTGSPSVAWSGMELPLQKHPPAAPENGENGLSMGHVYPSSHLNEDNTTLNCDDIPSFTKGMESQIPSTSKMSGSCTNGRVNEEMPQAEESLGDTEDAENGGYAPCMPSIHGMLVDNGVANKFPRPASRTLFPDTFEQLMQRWTNLDHLQIHNHLISSAAQAGQ